MRIDNLMKRTCNWLAGNQHEGYPIVLSSRVRLARNLCDYNFSKSNSSRDREEIVARVQDVFADDKLFEDVSYLRLDNISELERQILVERHLISHELGRNYKEGAVALEENERYSVMINEEDHLRLQAFNAGLDLKKAYSVIDVVEERLGSRLTYGYSTRYGYLTACPTNTGTGLRASVMVHLPGLVRTQQIRKVLPAVARLGLAIRGIFGEGTEVQGNLFQISNQITLGKTELEMVENIQQVAYKLINYEEEARAHLVDDDSINLADQLWRSYGVLRFARSLSLDEAMGLFSDVRLGVDLGFITEVDYATLNRLLMFVHPAHLQLVSGIAEEVTQKKINLLRAAYVREALEKVM